MNDRGKRFFRAAITDPYAAWSLLPTYPSHQAFTMAINLTTIMVMNAFDGHEPTTEQRAHFIDLMANRWGTDIIAQTDYVITIVFNHEQANDHRFSTETVAQTGLLITTLIFEHATLTDTAIEQYIAALCDTID